LNCNLAPNGVLNNGTAIGYHIVNKLNHMKKILFLLAFAILTVGASAQQKVVKDQVKTKKTTTVGQKVHNIFHKKKEYSGTKSKHIVKKEKSVAVKS
jgi:Na+-transporting methylmalonyl-CoA/oxaloacetate decarboxylase gamma subunit